jgi:hypothetical protein
VNFTGEGCRVVDNKNSFQANSVTLLRRSRLGQITKVQSAISLLAHTVDSLEIAILDRQYPNLQMPRLQAQNGINLQQLSV